MLRKLPCIDMSPALHRSLLDGYLSGLNKMLNWYLVYMCHEKTDGIGRYK